MIINLDIAAVTKISRLPNSRQRALRPECAPLLLATSLVVGTDPNHPDD
jgi:hypothetical protein